jgi:hypothetical protein
MEREVGTIAGDAIERLGNVIFGAVKFPEPERLDNGARVVSEWMHAVGSATDEESQAGSAMSGPGGSAADDACFVMDTREFRV